ncbi:MAG: hydantoinase B/oxoprolinase family protein [Chloroflexota bacterium]|nr:hydantoinase B/oxoprolinase family protein [Chloroflexota bacterium]
MTELLDPVFVEVLSSYLVSAAEEMTAAMVRSAYSTAIRDRKDCSSVLLTGAGEIAAQAADVPVHLGGLAGVVGNAVKRYGVNRLRDGDVLLANDPYQGSSSHLNDISAVCPIWLDGHLAMFAAITGHHADVGGRSPGSESVDSEVIYHEGIRLPALLAYRDGEPCNEVLELIGLNSRTPAERAGDLRAQVGAVLKGRQRVLEIAAKYGTAAVLDGIASLLSYTERRFRNALAARPDVEFSATESLDPDRQTGRPIAIAVRVEKRGDRIRLDFTGTSAQINEGRNVPWTGLVSAVYYALRSLVDPGLESNSGFFRAVEIVAPEGVLVNAQPPAAVSARVSTAQHIAGVIFKAFASQWLEQVVAGSDGRRKVIFSGVDHRDGTFFVYHESNAGGVGAHANGDGIDGAMAHVIQMNNLPVEALEIAYPLHVQRLELIPDSGGAGRWRGGAGVRRDYQVLGEEVHCSLVSEKSNDRLWGLCGGHAGARGRFVVNEGTPRQWEPDSSKLAAIELTRGETLSVQTGGGGGFGDPAERPIDIVVREVSEGRLTIHGALEDYGVQVTRSNTGEWRGQRPAIAESVGGDG